MINMNRELYDWWYRATKLPFIRILSYKPSWPPLVEDKVRHLTVSIMGFEIIGWRIYPNGEVITFHDDAIRRGVIKERN
jgi:hypothetical protein